MTDTFMVLVLAKVAPKGPLISTGSLDVHPGSGKLATKKIMGNNLLKRCISRNKAEIRLKAASSDMFCPPRT
jgi:hypothetical protein